MREDVEDLHEPVEEFDLFDQCMFTIGVTQYGSPDGSSGYAYGAGGRERRQALAMDVRGFDPPQYDLMAFPGRGAAPDRVQRGRRGTGHRRMRCSTGFASAKAVRLSCRFALVSRARGPTGQAAGRSAHAKQIRLPHVRS